MDRWHAKNRVRLPNSTELAPEYSSPVAVEVYAEQDQAKAVEAIEQDRVDRVRGVY